MSKTEQEKVSLVERAKVRFRDVFSDYLQPHHACLLWQDSIAYVLHKEGIDCRLQAGSASWKIVTDEKDDGVSSNYFSYIFDREEAKPYILQGMFPEIHIWGLIPDTWEIVDLTTGYQVQQCKQMIGVEWDEGCLPPSFVWHTIEDIDQYNAWVYRADKVACIFADAMIREFYNSQLREEYWK